MWILNLLILSISLFLIVFISIYRFHHQTDAIKKIALNTNTKTQPQIITDQDIRHLPPPVQRWLQRSGTIGKPPIQTVDLTQIGAMKLNPNQSSWIPSTAQQFFTINRPTFIWSVSMNFLGLPVTGRDTCIEGHGQMDIRLAGLIPLVQVSNNPKINQSALQRFLGEIVWFPSAALQSYITWKSINDNSVEASMSSGDTNGSATFFFNTAGDVEKFIAYRYKDIHDSQPLKWIASVKKISEINGYRIPTELEATWILPTSPFTWYTFSISQFKITH